MNNLKFVGGCIVIIFVLFMSYILLTSQRAKIVQDAVEGNKYMANTTKISEFEINKSEDEWKKILTPQQYYVLREAGIDRPFDPNDSLLHEKRKGTYVTADCGEPVFRSEQKFDSGTGWPSFWAPIEGSIIEHEDNTLGMSRIEVVGKKCGGHLGHVFPDGPKPTGLRYCINSSALKFIPDPDQ